MSLFQGWLNKEGCINVARMEQLGFRSGFRFACAVSDFTQDRLHPGYAGYKAYMHNSVKHLRWITSKSVRIITLNFLALKSR